MTDLQAAFPNLWYRLNAALADTSADACLSTTPPAVPATPADAVPDAPVVPPHSPVQAPPTGPTRPSAKHTPRVAPPPLSGPPPSDQPPAPTIITATPETPLSGTQAGHYPTRADRSDTVHNLLRAATDASCAVAARFSLEAFATRCNARRRRPDSVTPPIPARPERPRAEPGTRPNQINGATARRSRVAARHLIPEIQLHYRHFRPPEGPTPHRSSAARLNPPAAPPAPSPATAAK